MGEINPWLVLVIGLGTVFVGLLAIILLTKLMSFAVRVMDGKVSKAVEATPAAVQTAACAGGAPVIADRKKFDAVVAAAIAAYLGGDVSGLRIRSVKCLSEQAEGDRAQFVAAVSCAVASAMGNDVEGLRIHSIKKLA